MTLATTVTLAVVRGPVAVAKSLGRDRSSLGRSPPRRGRARFLTRRLLGGRASTSPSVGNGSTKRSVRSAHCGSPTRRPSSAASIRRRVCPCGLGPRSRTDRRSGSGAGVQKLASVASPAWPTAGWHPPTTSRRRSSRDAWQALGSMLTDRGRSPETFPNALATMWCYITDDRAEAERILQERVVPTVHRPEDDAPRTATDRPARRSSPRSCRRSPGRECNESSSGRSPTRCTNSSGSGTRYDRSSWRHDRGAVPQILTRAGFR